MRVWVHMAPTNLRSLHSRITQHRSPVLCSPAPSRVRPSRARLTLGMCASSGVSGCVFQMAGTLPLGPIFYPPPLPSSAGLSQSHLEEKEADKLLPARSQMPVQNEPVGQGQRTGAVQLGASCLCLWRSGETLRIAGFRRAWRHLRNAGSFLEESSGLSWWSGPYSVCSWVTKTTVLHRSPL